MPISNSVKLWDPIHAVNDRQATPAPKGTLAFALFLAMTGTLFIRPLELVPALRIIPIYQILSVLVVVSSISLLLPHLTGRALLKQPAIFFAVILLPIAVISNVLRFYLWGASTAAGTFATILCFYMPLVCLVNSSGRLRILIQSIAVFVAITGSLSLLRYHGIMKVADQYGTSAMNRNDGDDAGLMAEDEGGIRQLTASGIFSDPNDFAAVLVATLIIVTHCILDARSWLARTAWFTLVPIVGYAFAMTQSRGGFLALLGGGGIMALARFGWRRTFLAGIVVIPLILALFAGRQTTLNLTDENDTAHGRVTLWRDGIIYFAHSPLIGIGYGMYEEHSGLVAHNSYIHAFAEMGIFGGAAFVALFFIPFFVIGRLKFNHIAIADLELARLRAVVLGLLAAYAVALFSVSRTYALSTYLILAIGAVFVKLGSEVRPDLAVGMTFPLLARIGAASLMVLVVIYACVVFIA